MCSIRTPEHLTGVTPARAAEHRLAQLEQERRRIEAAIAEVLTEVEHHGHHRDDGHLSVRAWAMAVTNWSPAEATAQVRAATALEALPELRRAFGAGALGGCQVRAFGRVAANPRVAGALSGSAAPLVDDAVTLRFEDFHGQLRRWMELADADGAHRRHEDAHRLRSARIVDVGEETLIAANCSTMQGAVLREVFRAFCDAEFAADVEAAGPGGVLPRTDAQRRADALFEVFRAAAEGGHGGRLELCVNVVVDQQTFDAEVARLAGANVERRGLATYRGYRCETLDGTSITPAYALAAALVGHVRRVVIDSASSIIDLGRRRRFTGAAREALLMAARRCVWPGCSVPADHAQGDHVLEHGRGGLTNPANGDLLCGRHNRHKNRGYRTWKDPSGRWRTFRPDGSEAGPLMTGLAE